MAFRFVRRFAEHRRLRSVLPGFFRFPPLDRQRVVAAELVQILISGGGEAQLSPALLAHQVHRPGPHVHAVAPAAAGAGDAAPPGNLLELREHLVHDQAVGKGLRLILFLLHLLPLKVY